jgi:general secretion pathway protein H
MSTHWGVTVARVVKAWMPILETGKPNRHRQSGFSLIEILVVIVVISIVLSVTVLSFNLASDDRELRTEGRRFAALIEVTLDEAAMQGREFGIELLSGGYRFVEFDAFAGLWADIPGDDILRLRSLPEDVEFELFLEDKHVLLDDDPAPFEDPDENNPRQAAEVYAPHLLIYSSGETTPFELHLWRDYDDRRVILLGDAFGDINFADENTE